MFKKALVVCVVAAWITVVSATQFRIGGGSLELHGQLAVGQLLVETGAVLYGAGEVIGDGTIAGVVSPGMRETPDARTITFHSSVVFQVNSRFDCYAASNTAVDRIAAGGAVSGTCTVDLSKHANAIPLDQIIIDGDGASAYGSFALDGADSTNWLLETAAVGDLTITDLIGDTDGDDLPDWWEVEYYAGRTNAQNDADTDGDLMNSRGELLAGTDPTNENSVLEIYADVSMVSTDQVVVSWSSVSNKMYTLWVGTNLDVTPSILVESNLAATPPDNYYTNSVSSYEVRYYRVQLEP